MASHVSDMLPRRPRGAGPFCLALAVSFSISFCVPVFCCKTRLAFVRPGERAGIGFRTSHHEKAPCREGLNLNLPAGFFQAARLPLAPALTERRWVWFLSIIHHHCNEAAVDSVSKWEMPGFPATVNRSFANSSPDLHHPRAFRAALQALVSLRPTPHYRGLGRGGGR